MWVVYALIFKAKCSSFSSGSAVSVICWRYHIWKWFQGRSFPWIPVVGYTTMRTSAIISCPMCSLIHQKSQLWEYLCVYTEIFTLLHTYMEREAYLYAYGEVHIYLGTVKEPRHVSCMYVLTVQFVWNTVCTRTHAENGSQLRGLWSFKEMSE